MSGNHSYIGKGERWPHSTGKGTKIDQQNAGDRHWAITVRANDIQEALEKVELFRSGIESSPHVWMAPIQSVELVSS